MRIKAAVLEEFGAPLILRELEMADPQAHEVLVRLVAAGICHTDLYTWSGADPTGYAPCVLGHEGAGVVEHVGPEVTTVKPGDHVLTVFEGECGECAHCRDPRTNQCLSYRDQMWAGYQPDGTTRLSLDGQPVRHFMGTSTFAEYTVLPEFSLVPLDPELPLEEACLFSCGLTTGIGAALHSAEVRPGSSAVVFGTGVVGLGAVIGCRLAGAERIVAVDLEEARLRAAEHHGATDTVLAGPDANGQLEELLGPGADYAFEATGNVQVMAQAVGAARAGWGTVTLLGVAGRGENLEVVPRLLITGRRVSGCEFGNVKSRSQLPGLMSHWVNGDIDVASMVTQKTSLTDVNSALESLRRHEGLKTIISY
jgi:S-(hydroxymethyl)glutathione dehydrogenase / alcohol dehydrogenase